MHLLLCFTCTLVLGTGYCTEDGGDMLMTTLEALTRGVDYVHRKFDWLNLDAVFATRQLQEQLEAYLTHQPDVFLAIRPQLEILRDKAKETADKAIPYVYAEDPPYAENVGVLMNESKKIYWYPSLETSVEYVVEAVSCADYFYDKDLENTCYHYLIGGKGKDCYVPPQCYNLNEQYQQRSYALSHQVLFWQFLEARKCVDSVSLDRRMRLCSNVMRDAKRIAAAQFPQQNEDLFLELVGICGFWGFSDFNQPEWLEKILSLQQDSGCFANHQQTYCFEDGPPPEKTLRRVKRNEILLPDGCFCHNTGAGILALVVNVRFEAEKRYQRMTGQYNMR